MRFDYVASAAWGLVLLASWFGWGRLVAVALGARARAHAGLTLAWGYAATLALGGWLLCLGLARPSALIGLVALGLTGCLVRLPPRANAPERERRAVALCAGLALAVLGLLALSYAIGVFDPRYQARDDRAAYFMHAKKILETGTLYEPFSFRRIASYGGQSLLQALLLVGAPLERLNLLDKGVCRVALCVVLLAHALESPNRSLLAALVVSYAAAVYYDFTTNTASLFSGVLAFTGLWLTLDVCRREPGRPVVNGILTGLACAATLPLRQNYGLAAGLLVLFEHATRLRRTRDPRQGKELLCAIGSAALCAGGWALLQLDSCGTPLFPLLIGFANPEWNNVFSARDGGEYLKSLGNFLVHPFSAAPVLLCAVALLLPRRAADGASLRPAAAAGLVAFGANAWLLAHTHPNELARYTAAFLLPPALLGSAHAAATLGRVRSAAALRDWRVWCSLAQLFALLAFLPPTTRIPERARWLGKVIAQDVEGLAPDDALAIEAHARLQRAAPAGEKLLVMLDRPYLLDFRRNDAVSLDLPGGVSPPPGLHQLTGAPEVVSYFRELGYAWLGVIRPARSRELHELRVWQGHATSDVASRQVLGRTITRFYQQLGVIAASCRVAHDDGTLLLIDLSRCRFERPRL